MRFDTHQHQVYRGIDLHARTMYGCILHQDGEIMVHRQMKTTPEAVLQVLTPYRDGLVSAVECLFTWDLARRFVRSRRDSVCPWACAVHEGDPRRQSQER